MLQGPVLGKSRLAESLRLELFVLGLRDGTGVEQLLGTRDLLGRRSACDAADVVVLCLLHFLRLLRGALCHSVTARHQVNQRGKERQQQQCDNPESLGEAAGLVVTKEITDDLEQDDQVGNEDERNEDEPNDVPERHWRPFLSVTQRSARAASRLVVPGGVPLR